MSSGRTNQEGSLPFLKSSARAQEASIKLDTSQCLWPKCPVNCGPVSLVVGCVLTWGRESISKLLTLILFIICIFISHLWPATTSHCNFRSWSLWTLLLPLKMNVSQRSARSMTAEWSYSRKDLSGSPPGRDTLPLGSTPSTLIFCTTPHCHHFSGSSLLWQEQESALWFVLVFRWVHRPRTTEFGISLSRSCPLLVRSVGAEWEERLVLMGMVLAPDFPEQMQCWPILVRTSWDCVYFLMGLAIQLPPVGLAWSLESKAQETGCRVYVTVWTGTETEPAKRWEANAQTWLHILARWCSDALPWVLLNSSEFGSLSSVIFLSPSQWLHQRN